MGIKAWLKSLVLENSDVEWVINDYGELGVRIGRQCFFCYKGRSYQGGNKWREVYKREFGETVKPVALLSHPMTIEQYFQELEAMAGADLPWHNL